MASKVGGLTPLLLRLGLVLLGLAALFFIGGAAEAKVYTNATNHYHLTIPDNWNATETSSGVNVEEGFYSQWSISSSAHADANAKDTDAYVVAQATTQCDTVKGAFGGTYSTAPHAISAGGRHAGECVLDYTLLSTPYKTRLTVFGSDYYDMVYFVQANDNATHYTTLQSTWDAAVNGFAVDGEQAPAGGGGTTSSGGGLLSGTTLYILIAVIAIAVIGGAMAMRMRGKKKKQGGAEPPAAPPAAKDAKK